jgi:hypothetical protein
MFKAIFLALGVMVSTTAAQATVIDFGDQPGNYNPYVEDGFSFDHASLDNSGGNCPFSNPACMKLNSGRGGGFSQTIMTRVGGGVFDLMGFSFEFSGNANVNTLIVSALGYGDLTLTVGVGGILKNTSYSMMNLLFADVEAVTFRSTSGGTVRIDNISVAIAAVPIPAAGFLLLAGLGGLAAMRRRKVT